MQNVHFGVNSNNFGKPVTSSLQYPPPHYMGANPNGNFNGISTNTTRNGRMSDFSTAYNPNKTIIQPMDYTNRGELVHNNINPNVMHEYIEEYRIDIDSRDRNISVYPDPFSYQVNFNPIGAVSHFDTKTGTSTYVGGTPAPIIAKQFINVKYIKLDNAILPRYSQTTLKYGATAPYTPNDYEVDTSEASMLSDDRYTILHIKELMSDKILSTGSKQGFYLYADKLLGTKFYMATPYFTSRTFKNSNLGNINMLTIEFYNSNGTKIEMNNKDISASTTQVTSPLYYEFQNKLTFTIGVVESEINKETNFAR